MKNLSKKGFTLVELLVVISIIGLLSTIAVVSLGSARAKARDGKRIADVKQISTSLEQYYADQGGYPPSNLVTAGTPQLVGTTNVTLSQGHATTPCSALGFAAATIGTVYMSRVPPYPTPGPSGVATSCAGTYTAPGTAAPIFDAVYCYYTNGITCTASTDYKLTTKLEASNTAAGITGTNCVVSSAGMVCS
jgi:prepilin-type N-terminal cleavage/methylation domain